MPQTDDKIIEIDGKKYYAYNFPRPSVTVDCVIFGTNGPSEELRVLLIKRKNPPFKDYWALPGGFVNMDETSMSAAIRELKEETGVNLSAAGPIHFVGIFDAPERDPRGRVISHAYSAALNMSSVHPVAADDAKEVGWFNISQISEIAFDHNKIILAALEKLLLERST